MGKKVHYYSKEVNAFESDYLKVRTLEHRVYSNEKVALLPYLTKEDAHYKEWKIRAKTLERFTKYLQQRHPSSALLEIGCGNGWFSNQCAHHTQKVIGVDINQAELEQAAAVFTSEKVDFYYWNLFDPSPFKDGFDCIVLNAVVQYFPSFHALLNRLKELLNKKGEIHLLDSPFYHKQELPLAKERTLNYYKKMGVPAMANHYFHHSIEAISDFEVLYKPNLNPINRLLKGKDSPFGWYRLKC